MLNDQLVRYTRKVHARAVMAGWLNQRYLSMILRRQTGVGFEGFPLNIPRVAWLLHDADPLALIEGLQVGSVVNVEVASRMVGVSSSFEGWAVEESDPDELAVLIEDRRVKYRPDRRSMRTTMSVLVDGDAVTCLEFEDQPGVVVQGLDDAGPLYTAQRSYRALLGLAQRLMASVDLASEGLEG